MAAAPAISATMSFFIFGILYLVWLARDAKGIAMWSRYQLPNA
jgi:hypothetical protein